jgi:transposase-like protein
MDDYPETLLDLEKRFSTEEACRDYLANLRWPKGFVCPRCKSTKSWRMERGLWLCAGCRRQVSVTAGTVFQDLRLPLTLWFRAIWYVTSQKNGASALSIQRILGLRTYRTAWTWLHKLRRAMVRPGRDRLRGMVEVDETFFGGLEEGVHGRETEDKELVAIAAEKDGHGIGRIRLRRIPDASERCLHAFVLAAVEPGSLVHTDGWRGYDGLEELGYRRKVTVQSHTNKKAHELLPRVHRVASLLKRWSLGTHQGGIGRKHLDYYLDEFTFRFNRRNSRSRGKLFFRLVQQAVQVAPLPYDAIVGRPEVE